MSQKKRIYDLAKDYGMSGQDLARKLRDLGFSQVKSHMTALDDFEVLQVQGILEAHGIVAESSGGDGESSDAGGGLILRKKKKKKKAPADEDSATAETAAAEAEPAPRPSVVEELAERAPAEEAPAATEAEAPAAEAPAAEDHEPPAEVAPPARPEAAEAEADEPAPAPAPAAEAAPETPVEAPEPVAEVEPAAAPETVRAEEPEPAAASASASAATEETAPEAPAAEAPETAEQPAPAEAKAAAEEPASDAGDETEDDDGRKPKGKVVGFIDLSKIKTTERKKPESRRLRSKDDVAPDVQPTLGQDRRRALMRGASGARGQLSASQLREREAGRYLRRRTQGGPGGGGGGGGGRRGGHHRSRDVSTNSPYAGQTVRIEAPITVRKLADNLAIAANAFLNRAFQQLGFGAVNINSTLDEDTAALLAGEFDVEIDIVQQVEAEEQLVEDLRKKRSDVAEEEEVLRPPTLAFLGHVDHGKTTLIDRIRASQITEDEAGGITQHIGAYQVTNDHGHTLTIIDTPGHAAFTNMRARGAKAVDIVVLVVAADSGVQPHTEEAINHARAAETPIVVAMTKMDKAEANPQRVKEQLAALDVVSEEWGGEVAVMEVSGITGQGIEELLERVFLESEVLDKKCHPESPASGVVLEAEVQQGKGIVAHLLVQDGTLRPGDVILAGEGYGKVRSMHDDRGRTMDTAEPSRPVEVSGLSALPGVGDPFYVVENLATAKEVADERERKNRTATLAEGRKFNKANLLEAVAKGDMAVVNVIVRADVQGSVEVLKTSLTELSHPEVEVRVLNSGVGAVPESDVLLASTSGALIVAFNVGVNDKARQAAEKASIDIRRYSVIYEVLDDVRAMMEGHLAPEVSEEVTGHVEIRRLFRSSRLGNIAGSHVIDGTISRDSRIRLLRDGTVVHTGRLASLKREKDDAKEVREGFDCGIVVANYQDIKEGDIIEAYKIVETKRTLDDAAKS